MDGTGSIIVDDIHADLDTFEQAGSVVFRNEIITGPCGEQVVFDDPSGNPIALLQPAGHRPTL
jgi:predicted enzyme related to lactoylglutathione lyase